ncbi:MAG: ribose-5-phosphate isomerase RpiA [Thermoplasmata archaeon]|nr:MAG: ribose-5-phosphate isomerase RpiA [Thermoplasmata archaeon]
MYKFLYPFPILNSVLKLDREDLKKMAAQKALDYVEDGMVVGLGTGSTVEYFIPKLSEKIKKENIELIAIPTSHRTKSFAQEFQIPLSTLREHPEIDITIDGADEVDPDLNLIKGGGGALTREKIVAYASKKEIIIVDESKLVQKLGVSFPLPIEVVPFGWYPTKLHIERLFDCSANLRMADGIPFTTDNTNYILDCEFSEIERPDILEKELNDIPGVVEVGLFVNLADIVIAGTREGIRIFEK